MYACVFSKYLFYCLCVYVVMFYVLCIIYSRAKILVLMIFVDVGLLAVLGPSPAAYFPTLPSNPIQSTVNTCYKLNKHTKNMLFYACY